MSYLGSWKIDDTLTFTVVTHTPATGAVTDADAVPDYRVYEDETGVAILTGSLAKLDDANTTGHYSEQVTLSAANGLEKGKSYNIYINATVGGIEGATVKSFQMEAEVDANVVSDKTGYGLANDAITAAKYDESTAFPVKSDDSGATQIARTGADGDTLETLSDQVDLQATLSINTEARLAELDAGNLPTDIAAIPTTAMRGTDNAALASVCTESRLAELDAANLPAIIDAIKVVTDLLADSATTLVSAAAAAGTLSTTQMTTNLTEVTNDHYNGRIIIWTSGVLQNQATDITDYDGGSKLLTYTQTTEAPGNGDTFVIV
jgi:hypothetical protein